MGLPGGRALYTGKNAYASQGFENDTRLGLMQLGKQIVSGLARIASSVIYGVTDGSNATAGYVGEFISAEASAGSIGGWATGTPQNITSITLTPGDWEVTAEGFWGGGPITGTNALMGISTTPAGFGTWGDFETPTMPAAGSSNLRFALGGSRQSLTVTTPVYLVGRITFTAGTPTAGGIIRARRVR